MEKKVIKEEENNNLYTKIETTETKPEDGFINKADINKVDINNYREYQKGYSKSFSFETNDPRITRPFAYGISGLFLVIGIIVLLLNLISINFIMIFIGVCFIFVGISGFIKSKKDIDKIEQELKKAGNYHEKLSKEEKEEYKKIITDGISDVRKSTFTKDHFNWFLKVSLPIYCVISIIVFLLITIFVNIFLGIFILIILILCGLFYYWLIAKICKWR